MISRSYFIGLFFVAVASLIVLSQCQPDKPNRFKNSKAHHQFVNFNRMSRLRQVEECGKCHQEIYKNEMSGPHANAYKNLQAHVAFVNSRVYDCSQYRSHVQDALPNCTKCHTGGNLFETVFKNDADKERVIEGIKNGNDYSALPRESSSWVTGVDCITCHYNGKNVVTAANFIKSPGKPGCPDFCNPAPSVLFTSNMTCYPCHQEQVVSMDGYPSKEVACSSCHGEKDADAKLTHYTYWAHNPIGRVTPPSLNIFNGINAFYSKNNHAVQIVWMNEVLPHMRSVCTELVAVVEVSKNNSTVKSDTIRINQKSYHDKQLAPWFKDRPVPGCSGTEFKHLNDSIVRFISLPPSLKHADLEVNIIGYKKEQYWLSDSMRSVYMQKKVVLHL